MAHSAHDPDPVIRRIRSFGRRGWLFPFALALFVGVTVWFSRQIYDFFQPAADSIMVPAFVGQTLTDAQNEAQRIKLTVNEVSHKSSERFPKDVVMAQKPEPGKRVREGRQVALVVSDGLLIFPMPDVRYQSLREANLDLAHAKLRLKKTVTVANDEVPANHVVGQEPPPLTSVREGSEVTLQISKGPPPYVRIPNFVNSTIEQARVDAARAKIQIGQVVWTPLGTGAPPRGFIVRQNPPAGAQIDAFTPVSLQVSAGPAEAGYVLHQFHATLQVPPRDGSVNVRLEVRDQTGTWNMFNGYAQGGQKLDFNMTVVGAAELDTFINNELVNQTKLSRDIAPPAPPAARTTKRLQRRAHRRVTR